MKRNVALGWCLVVALGAASCTEQVSDPAGPTAGSGAELNRTATSPKYGLERGPIEAPGSGRITDQYFTEACRRAIDGDDYTCPASTPVIDWWLAAAYDVINNEPEIFDLLYNQLLADLVPTYDALYFQTEATPQYFGYNGEYTQLMQKTHTDTKRFWNVKSDDIQLIGMHGTMLLDEQRVARTYQLVFGLSAADAAAAASAIRAAMLESETLNGGNHPLFSFNAFALSAPDFGLPDKIVMGDAIMAGYQALGLGDVAPQGIYAHEFGHHIQFENGYFDERVPGTKGRVTEAEKTRYTELMADAYSAYFLTHSRGLALNQKRVEQFLEVFFQIGDCAFSNPGHHGTPNQRMAAARFGFTVADEAQKQGHILTSEKFHERFVAVYTTLVAPDAT